MIFYKLLVRNKLFFRQNIGSKLFFWPNLLAPPINIKWPLPKDQLSDEPQDLSHGANVEYDNCSISYDIDPDSGWTYKTRHTLLIRNIPEADRVLELNRFAEYGVYGGMGNSHPKKNDIWASHSISGWCTTIGTLLSCVRLTPPRKALALL